MPIEFRCSHCNQLLRTPDGTEGKQTKCPQCGQLMRIPGIGSATPELGRSGEPAVSPGARSPGQRESGVFEGRPLTGPDFENPYAPPTAAGPSAGTYARGDTQPRDGPPWERDGYSLHSFWETAKPIIIAPTTIFSSVRREGGLGSPILFAMAGSLTGSLGSVLWTSALQFMLLAAANGPNAPDAVGVHVVIALIQAVIGATVGVLIGLFLGTGIIHLALMMLGGANDPFETTFRVVAYTNGAVALLNIIPCVGPFLAFFSYFISTIIGVAHMQGISGAKSATAVLLPILACGGCLLIVFGAAFMGIFFAAQNGQF